MVAADVALLNVVVSLAVAGILSKTGAVLLAAKNERQTNPGDCPYYWSRLTTHGKQIDPSPKRLKRPGKNLAVNGSRKTRD